ncbi:MAG: RNA polymerase sigma factor [Anaerolineae bacterium]
MPTSAPNATNALKENNTNPYEKDINLAKMMSCGNEDAVGIFCEAYIDKLHHYVVSLARDLNEQDIEEIVQITMAAATANIESYKGKSSLQTWVFSMARHKLYDLLRKRHSRNQHEVTFSHMPEHWDPAHDGRVEEEILDKEFREQVRRAVSQLPPQEAEVISLRYMVGMGTDEIAQIIGKSQRVTQKILTQARMRIRSFLLPLVQNE